jgi:hypothetical protein
VKWKRVALALTLSACADLATTEIALARPWMVEVNPLAQEQWARVLLQVAFVVVGTGTFALIARWSPLLAAFLLAFVVSMKVTVAALNIQALQG